MKMKLLLLLMFEGDTGKYATTVEAKLRDFKGQFAAKTSFSSSSISGVNKVALVLEWWTISERERARRQQFNEGLFVERFSHLHLGMGPVIYNQLDKDFNG